MEENRRKFKRYRFLKELISFVVFHYYRFTLSLRDVEEMLQYRGLVLSHETIRQWSKKFGLKFANWIKMRQPRRGDKWHLDEVCLVINKKKYWLWRAVDQDGYELDVLLQGRRDKQAAKRFFRKLLKGLHYVPRVAVTDKLKSYGAAFRETTPKLEHRQHKGLNNRAEISHQPTRQQEKQMRRFKSPKQAQIFLSIHGKIYNLFRCGRYTLSANKRREVFKDLSQH